LSEAEIERVVQEFVNTLASDFGVSPPRVMVVKPRAFAKLCSPGSAACYRWWDESIVLLEGHESLGYVLHEFWHHYQYVKGGRKIDRAFPSEDFDKPHCKRTFERDAKVFEKSFDIFYSEVWERLVGKRRG